MGRASRTPAVAAALIVGTLAALPAFSARLRAQEARGARSAQSAPTARTAQTAPKYEFRQDHDPDGIGKFYMGREIAQVMGHEAADWLDRPEREAEEAPSRLIRVLGLKDGMTVCDLGCGSGYLTFPMAKRVAPTGKVYAEDIQPEMLDIVRKRMKERGVSNVVPVLGTITDCKLPDNSTDLIMLVDVYHEFDHPWEMTRSMVRALKPGGRLVFVEYRKEDPDVPIKLLHKMSVAQVRREMSVHLLRFVGSIETLPRQHVIVFSKLPARL